MTDVLIVAGVVCVGVGLGLFDWRYLVMYTGLLLLAVGGARLRGGHGTD